MSACLYIVATPIGHLGDLTSRAIEVLKEVAVIAAEDTRHSKRLLQHFSIQTPMITLHEHNEREQAFALLARIKQGESMALISDAGTPLVSDPGYHFVRLAHELGVKVVPIPGASALIAALSVSGLASDEFRFVGFLPAKSSGRGQRLQSLSADTATLIFYEAPHRIYDCIAQMAEIFGAEREACIARELTKQYETIKKAPLAELITWLDSDSNQQRGEFVVLVAGAEKKPEEALSAEDERIMGLLLEQLKVKAAAQLAAEITGKSKRDFYQYALSLIDK
ncbi:Ribosomal RNA small subunit methyltransferase I [Piscirickettsia salmonis]|uniref:Ribosomal RNA small subunit methyltransferase I n=1 Tax=Piscirickettsia salmonis TaxID=1238 RepID=T1R2U6_PISSA|nr:16S rRNA (cytidine(1402)-2'-O)-methyltransferase [Piscirickettsia salmonis]AGG17602.1 Uroporphyrin-III C/tetrapyrrole methyltransferase [Piscirickettsia salmonis LF-89 = ATCC VR-1361]AKP72792.2 tetrapyrrole methylase [Piscirickettsia salmonis LF-89 = ATCC VR-1361]ALB23694.1 tetrapyrrole methylase [Piscirickettsia salmonis]ALY03549.1 tetrapyrrole methylase [Piscirickettsia salmonis]AMA43115.1 tetrapyrrole methylase [Piscirickettsia salmonis]